MPFTVADRAPSRLDQDFQINAVPGYAATGAEANYIVQVHQALDQIAQDEATDAAGRLRNALLAARRGWRVTAVARLRAAADSFASGQDQLPAAANRAQAEITRYTAGQPDIVIAGVTPERFPGEFSVRLVGLAANAADDVYFDRLRQATERMAADETADVAAGLSDAALEMRRDQRKKTARDLRKDAQDWKEGQRSEDTANNVLVLRGGYQALRERLGQSLFTVSVVREAANAQGNVQGLATDLFIRVEQGLPPPNDVVSPDKQDLFVQLNNASTVVGTVCRQMRGRAERRFWRTAAVRAALAQPARHLLDEYIIKLSGIGRLGLEGPHTTLAKLALTSLKAEFVAREAGRITSRYARRLGFWAGGFALVFLLIYVFIARGCHTSEMSNGPCAPWWDLHKSFLLLAAGAAIGTWVSFSVRRVDLPFEDLGLLEEQALDPPFRIIFVVTLALAASLLFWTGAVNIEIGNLRTGPESFKLVGSIAILIGVFCGLSERALATAISGRAAAFVRTIAGA